MHYKYDLIITVKQKNVLSTLKENGIEIYRTDCHGDITITSDGHSLKVKTEKQPGEELVMKEGFVPTPVPEPVVEEPLLL